MFRVGKCLSTQNRAGNRRPSLNLNFQGGKLDSRVTFTRSTTGTSVGSNGLIQSAAINAPRFDYDPITLACKGLLIEEQRVNLLTYSEDFSNAAWNVARATITANSTISPDGTVNADALVEDTTNNSHPVYRLSLNVTAQSYTVPLYVKAANRTKMRIAFAGTAFSTSPLVNFDLTAITATGVNGASGTITNAGNGWYRCTITSTATITASDTQIYIQPLDASGAASYTGSGTAAIYLWGAQLEAGAFATSYIPTVASQVTRTADNASMTGTNFSSWYNQSEGTVFANFVSAVLSTSDAVVFGGNSNGFQLRMNSNVPKTSIRALADLITSGTALTTLATTGVRIAGAYKSGTNAATGNGNTATTSATAFTIASSPVSVNFGSDALANSSYINGTIKSISYYPRRLTNAELQAITA